MKAGFSEVNITPPNSVFLVGFGGRDHKSEGISDDIFLKTIALEDDNGEKLIIVSADILHFDKAMTHRIKYWAKKTLGLNPGQIIFNATHTHYAPLLAPRTGYPEWGIDIKYVEAFEKSIMRVIEGVNSNLFEAKITYTPAKAHFGINRRLPVDGKTLFKANANGYYDPDFPVFAIYDTEDNLKVLLYSYACHPTSNAGGLYDISADFPGAIAEALKSICGKDTFCMFMQGAGGSIKHANNARDKFFDPEEISLVEKGRKIADIVLKAIKSPECCKLKLDLKVSSELEFPLPYDLDTMPSMDSLLADSYDEEKTVTERIWSKEMFENIRSGNVAQAYMMTASAVRLCDGLGIVAMSGEVTAELGRQIKDTLSCKDVIFLGYCNYTGTYVPTSEMLPQGGYEAYGYIKGQIHPAIYTNDISDRMIGAAKCVEKEVI